MPSDRLLLIILIGVIVLTASAFWLDILKPRKRRREERRTRRAWRRKQKLRYRFWHNVLRPLRTRRLTDQRSSNDKGSHEHHAD